MEIKEKAKEYSQEFGSVELQEVSYNSFMCGAETQKKCGKNYRKIQEYQRRIEMC